MKEYIEKNAICERIEKLIREVDERYMKATNGTERNMNAWKRIGLLCALAEIRNAQEVVENEHSV